MADRSEEYGTARVPPATPPAIQPDAEPLDARERARDDGDSAEDGNAPYREPDAQSEIDKEREAAMQAGERRDGMGEPALDALPAD